MNKRIIVLVVVALLCIELYAQQTDTIAVGEVVVTGTRNATDMRHLPLRVSIIDKKNIESQNQQSLLPMLTEQIPGLFVTSKGVMGYGVSTGASGGISLRGIGGSPTTRMLVLIDGQPQYVGLMGHPIADAYQSLMAEKIEVLRGPASVLYGSNAMGGVINIVTTQNKINGAHTHVNAYYGSYNTLSTEVLNKFRNNKFGSTIAVAYNRTDGHRPNMEYDQITGYAKLSYDITPNWTSSGNIDITHFNSSNPGTIVKPLIDNDAHITRGIASVALENKYDKTSGALHTFFNWGHHKIDDGYNVEAMPKNYLFHLKDRMVGVSLYQSAAIMSGNRITVGADYQYITGRAWRHYEKKDSIATIVDNTEQDFAAYADFRQAIGSFFTFNVGIRADNHTKNGLEWVPQFGVAAHLPKTIEIKLSAGKGFRNPTIRELYMFNSKNPDLTSERLWNYELSMSQRLLKNTLSYGVNLFYINADNLIQTIPIDGVARNVNSGTVENYGIELELTYQVVKSLQINSNYSWLHMKNPIIAAPENKFYLGGVFNKERFSLSSGIQIISGLYTSVSPEKTENYTLWNMNFNFLATKYLTLFVKGENLLAQEYEINAGFPMPKTTIYGGVKLKF